MEEDERKAAWDKVYDTFDFKPDYYSEEHAFKFDIPYDEYQLTGITDYENYEKTMREIMVDCIGDDEYMYALNWQHTGFRYNPKGVQPIGESEHVDDSRYFGGYVAYYLTFYPDGDYYFFIARDFSWGYLSHPWQKRVWIFGDKLRNRVTDSLKVLELAEI